MSKYRKKPVVIDAFRFGYDGRPDWFMDALSKNEIVTHNPGRHWKITTGSYCLIKTLEGEMRGECGDWIIRGVKGEIYPCKHDIFEATYEAVEPTQ